MSYKKLPISASASDEVLQENSQKSIANHGNKKIKFRDARHLSKTISNLLEKPMTLTEKINHH